MPLYPDHQVYNPQQEPQQQQNRDVEDFCIDEGLKKLNEKARRGYEQKKDIDRTAYNG